MRKVLYVVRIAKNGCFANSKPCRQCMKLIVESGVNVIVYTTGDEKYPIRKITTEELLKEPEHLSGAERAMILVGAG